MARHVRVLSIDGGGIRGVIPAAVLTEIERRTSRTVPELFDLVAGTSTGGIIALAGERPPRPLPARGRAHLLALGVAADHQRRGRAGREVSGRRARGRAV